MTAVVEQLDPGTFPAIYYRDAPAAMEWLCQAFGFAQKLVVYNPDGSIDHAQLVLGSRIVMLASAVGREVDIASAQADEQTTRIVVADAPAHCARARIAGAAIIADVTDEQRGLRGYSCRDPEGHLWSFDSYSRSAHPPAPQPEARATPQA